MSEEIVAAEEDVAVEEAAAAEENAAVEEVVAAEEVEKENSEDEKSLKRPNHKTFNSENFKIEVRNLSFYSHGELKKLLKKLELNFCKIKCPPCRELAYVCLRTESDRKKALELLNGYKWKGRELHAFIAKATEDPFIKRRKVNKDNEKIERTTMEATCPLYHLSYEDQLKQKSESVHSIIKGFMHDLLKINKNAKEAIDKFEYMDICPSPEITSYRNKNEFAVGKNSQGETIVGFRIGSYADGSVEVSSEIDNLPQLSPAAKWAVKSFRGFLAKTHFEPFNPVGNKGHIRQLIVRTSDYQKAIMIIVGIYSSNLSATELQELKDEITNYYKELEVSENEECDYKLSSLYYLDVKNRETDEINSRVEHLAFETHITDVVQNIEFRISPLAFFQINNKATDVLYQKIIEFAKLDQEYSVLDICCGTGTIALSIANHCKRVVGVDNNKDAIEDAKYNATKNNITNCTFIAQNAEIVISHMCSCIRKPLGVREAAKIVAIIDPPRAGVHNRCITAIRKEPLISRLVYISCSPKQAQRNWIDLCRPTSRQYRGMPFVPVQAVAVDMFPHTSHVELVILFERLKYHNDSTNCQTQADESVIPENIDN